MTRINSGVDVKRLTDKHLLAEHREIKRICDLFTRRKNKMAFAWSEGIPENFTLGKGHVLFFLDKPYFTFTRYIQILTECKARGFNITDYSKCWDVYLKDKIVLEHPRYRMKEYKPSKIDQALVINRITDRINEQKSEPLYCGQTISRQAAIQLLKGL